MRVTNEDVTRAVFDFFVENERAATVKDIAGQIGCSESTIRKRLEETGYVPDCCDITDAQVAVREKNYNTLLRYTQVTAFLPTRAYLVEEIRRARGGEA